MAAARARARSRPGSDDRRLGRPPRGVRSCRSGRRRRGMFKGKEPIHPIFTRLASVIQELGDDVKAEPRQTYVAFSRVRQFAVLQPSTATRLDVGLVLPDAERDTAPASGRLVRLGPDLASRLARARGRDRRRAHRLAARRLRRRGAAGLSSGSRNGIAQRPERRQRRPRRSRRRRPAPCDCLPARRSIAGQQARVLGGTMRRAPGSRQRPPCTRRASRRSARGRSRSRSPSLPVNSGASQSFMSV